GRRGRAVQDPGLGRYRERHDRARSRRTVTDRLTSFFPAGRDRGVTVAVEGFFAFVWFGWGQAAPPSWLVVPLAVGGRPGVPAHPGGGPPYTPARRGAWG